MSLVAMFCNQLNSPVDRDRPSGRVEWARLNTPKDQPSSQKEPVLCCEDICPKTLRDLLRTEKSQNQSLGVYSEQTSITRMTKRTLRMRCDGQLETIRDGYLYPILDLLT